MNAILELGRIEVSNADQVQRYKRRNASIMTPNMIRASVDVWQSKDFHRNIQKAGNRTRRLAVIGEVARENKGRYVAGAIVRILAEKGPAGAKKAAALLKEYARENPAAAGAILATLESSAPFTAGVGALKLDFSDFSSAVNSVTGLIKTGTDLYGAYKEAKAAGDTPVLTPDLLRTLAQGGAIGGALKDLGIQNLGINFQDPTAQKQVDTALKAAGTSSQEVKNALAGFPVWAVVLGGLGLIAAVGVVAAISTRS